MKMKLIQAIIPANVTEIKTSAFEGCEGLKTVNLPEGITEIPASFLAQSLDLERYIKSTDTSAGLTPDIRDA